MLLYSHYHFHFEERHLSAIVLFKMMILIVTLQGPMPSSGRFT